jgi:endonuclease/exonuclease/phosphatase (EEP) superfamily protein YafD
MGKEKGWTPQQSWAKEQQPASLARQGKQTLQEDPRALREVWVLAKSVFFRQREPVTFLHAATHYHSDLRVYRE